jgi:arsenical pump membrane protein
VLLVVLVVEYAGLRLLFRRELAAEPELHAPAARDVEHPPLPRLPLVVVALMLVGFGVGSPSGIEPFWWSGAAALVLVAWARRRGLLDLGDAVGAAHPAFALFVLCLGVVVAALSQGFLGDWVSDRLPDGTGFVDLLVVAVLATVLANVLTNLSAALLLVPLLVPLGDAAVLAALLGLNIGSGLSYTGSLANLLWRRGMVRLGERPSLREFHRVSLLVTPVSLLAAVAVLSLVT